jgi:hypothetical protein
LAITGTLHDKDMREPLFDFLEEKYGKVRIIEEKQMGRSRADVVMVTESALCGIEIKSDADTYARLARQVKDYDKYYDYNLAVVGTSHALHIKEHVPEYWGIITVELVGEIMDFYVLREAQENPHVTWKRKLEILWKSELAILQAWNQMPKYKEKSKAFVVGKIIERLPDKIPEQKLKEQISEILFERDYNTIQKMIADYKNTKIRSNARSRSGRLKRR